MLRDLFHKAIVVNTASQYSLPKLSRNQEQGSLVWQERIHVSVKFSTWQLILQLLGLQCVKVCCLLENPAGGAA
jgi:hypothetical protein